MPRKPKPDKKRKSLRLYVSDQEWADFERRAATDHMGDNLPAWLMRQIRRQNETDDKNTEDK